MDTDLTVGFGPRRERLLYLVADRSAFAAEHLHLGRAARDMGFEVMVAAPPADQTAADARLEREGLRPVFLDPLGPAETLRTRWQWLRTLVRLLQQEQPTIVHMIGLSQAVLGTLAARWAGVAGLVAEIPGLGRLDPTVAGGHRLRRLAALRGLGLAAATAQGRILVQTPEDAELLERLGGVAPDRVVLTPGPGADPVAFPAMPLPDSHPPCVTVVTPMAWEAGLDLAVEAQRLLLADGAPFRLLLVGAPDPDDPDAIPEQQLQDWEAQPGVFWLGARTDLCDIYRETHIALLASPGGVGIPTSLVQAAACARPIVTTDVPGSRRIVRSWQTGLLVPPDDARALADALRILVEDAEVRERFGKAARLHVEAAFTHEHAASLVAGVYRDVRQAINRPAMAEPA